ncbi:uncharacterized protein LOC142320696 [Lycorma delicatula]|uniref:uncharacterized protein LOC142320696 n=1 Tax=Lycorma delicatula TaxID=130591 RepID=UPI003F51461D
MRSLVLISLIIASLVILQVHCEEESIDDQLSSTFDNRHEIYNKEITDLKKSTDSLKKITEQKFKEKVAKMNHKIDGIMKSARERRSPQTYAEHDKDQLQEAKEKLNSAYSGLKDSISNFFSNVSHSEIYTGVSDKVEKIKKTVEETGSKIKSSIHELTAPKKDSEESKEK